MIEQRFDALTRRAALLVVGTGLLALAGPRAAGGKQNKTKKIKKKAKKKCQNQVGQCEAKVLELCEDNQACIDAQLPCCPKLATCDLLGLFACVGGAI